MRDKAAKLAARFEGECLSDKKLSIVKGAEAFKFRCFNGHIFYKFVTELQKLKNFAARKMSKTTATSSSADSSSSSSFDEDMLASEGSLEHSLESIWCPKCEAFWKSAEILAKDCGFQLCGELYSRSLSLKCLKAQHSTSLSYSRRLQGNLKCSACRKEERESVKQRLREEERLQDAYYTEMQEQMFAEARREMEKELASSGFKVYAESTIYINEAQRQSLIEQQINQTASQLASRFMASEASAGVSKDQAYVVYKFLNTPHEMLVAGMTSMQPQQLVQFFRKLAIQLHPDKNNHPQATDAFQAVQTAMEKAKEALRAAAI